MFSASVRRKQKIKLAGTYLFLQFMWTPIYLNIATCFRLLSCLQNIIPTVTIAIHLILFWAAFFAAAQVVLRVDKCK